MNPPIPRKPHEPSPTPPKHPGGQLAGTPAQKPPDWREQAQPQPAAVQAAPQPAGFTKLEEPWTKSLFTGTGPAGRATPQPTPPAGFTVLRTITVQVYGAVGHAAMYYVNEVQGANTYNQYHGSQSGVVQDIRNRLSPPPAPVA